MDLTKKIRNIGRLTNTFLQYKIKNGNFDGLIEFLKNELASTDVASVIVTMQACTAITKNLRESFAVGVQVLINNFLLKLSDTYYFSHFVPDFLDAALAATDLSKVIKEVIPCITH